jgi:hypothetical protein
MEVSSVVSRVAVLAPGIMRPGGCGAFVRSVQQDDERQAREGTALVGGAADLLDSALQEAALGFGGLVAASPERELSPRSGHRAPALDESLQPRIKRPAAASARGGGLEGIVANVGIVGQEREHSAAALTDSASGAGEAVADANAF